MGKREFLMLAHELKDEPIARCWASEKLDGSRALWDGGASRGVPAAEVPYLNTAKDARLSTPPISTGLISRYGKVIRAPDWWLDALPVGTIVDMELWMGRKTFQQLRSTVAEHVPGPGWERVVGYALDAPCWWQLLEDGDINNANWRMRIDRSRCIAWLRERGIDAKVENAMMPDEAFVKLESLLGRPVDPPEDAGGRRLVPLRQHRLSHVEHEARDQLTEMLSTRKEAEGVVLRVGDRPWYPKRVKSCLKAKSLHDMEGTVVGFTWGRETDRGSRLLGMMGALILRLDSGVRLELSGFTDAERQVTGLDDADPAEPTMRPGQDASVFWIPTQFPRGSRVTFTYRELSDDGVPKEARYLRRYDG